MQTGGGLMQITAADKSGNCALDKKGATTLGRNFVSPVEDHRRRIQPALKSAEIAPCLENRGYSGDACGTGSSRSAASIRSWKSNHRSSSGSGLRSAFSKRDCAGPVASHNNTSSANGGCISYSQLQQVLLFEPVACTPYLLVTP
jgi:hypothetical protein